MTAAQPENWHEKWNQLVVKTWSDQALKERLLADPRAVLREHGFEVPPGVELRIVEDTDQVHYLKLPARPSSEGLSAAELDQAAGGMVPLDFYAKKKKRMY